MGWGWVWGRAALCLSLVFVAREALLVGLTPPLHAPDEQAHFDSVQWQAQRWSLPVLRPDCIASGGAFSPEIRAVIAGLLAGVIFHPETPLPPLAGLQVPAGADARATDGCNYVAIYPPVYYASAAALVSLRPGATVFQRIAAARLASVLWGLVGVLAAFACGVLLARGAGGGSDGVREGLLLGLSFALQPMMGFLFASVNNDAAVFGCAAVAGACLAWRSRGGGFRALAALALVCLVGTLCKATFTLLLPWIGLLALLAGPRTPGSFGASALALLPAAAAQLLWMRHLGGVADARINAAQRALPLLDFVRDQVLDGARWKEIYGRQLWLSWGWLDVVLRPGWYLAVRVLLALALVGLVLGWRRLSVQQRVVSAAALVCGLGLTASLLALEYRLMRAGEGRLIAGRYFLGLWPLFALALLTGLRALGERLRLRLDLAALLPASLLVLDGAAVQRCATRYTARGESAVAHARAVYELFAPGWFWAAVLLQAAAIAGAAVLIVLATRGQQAARR